MIAIVLAAYRLIRERAEAERIAEMRRLEWDIDTLSQLDYFSSADIASAEKRIRDARRRLAELRKG